MRCSITLIACLAALLCVAAGQEFIARRNENDCVPSAELTASSKGNPDFFPRDSMIMSDEWVEEAESVKVDTALGFTVTYYPTYKVVNNTISGNLYVLYQCGVSPPKDVPEGAKVFQVPVTAVSVPDTTSFAFVDALGLQDRITIISPYVTEACGQTLVECNRTATPSPDGSFLDMSNATAVDEAFGGVADSVFGTMAPAGPLGIAFSAVLDPGPLHRAEWLKYMALFFNAEAEANRLFNETRDEYETYQDIAASADNRPVMAWISHFAYGGDEAYQVSFDEYKVALTTDANADMLDYDEVMAIQGVTPSPYSMTDLEFTWGKGNTTFATKEAAMAAFQELLLGVDVVIDETYAPDAHAYNMTSFKAEFGLEEGVFYPFLAEGKHGQVFRQDGRISATGGTAWFESAVVNAGDVLRDVVRAAHPDLVKNPKSYNYLRNIAAGEKPIVITSASCRAEDVCRDVPHAICPAVSVCPDGTTASLVGVSDDGECDFEPCTA